MPERDVEIGERSLDVHALVHRRVVEPRAVAAEQPHQPLVLPAAEPDALPQEPAFARDGGAGDIRPRERLRERLARAGREPLVGVEPQHPGLATLLERNLVTIRGRSKVVGRPLLYGTTQEFLEYFGLRDLAELPRPEELRALVAAREPEQLDLMELEVVSQVASDLATGEASGAATLVHEVEPLEDDGLDVFAAHDAASDREGSSDLAPPDDAAAEGESAPAGASDSAPGSRAH